MTLSEIVSRVIELADTISTYYDVEDRKRHPNYPLVGPDEDDEIPPPPEEKELKDFLSSLSAERLLQLMLIRDLAWARYPVDGLADYYEKLLTKWSTCLEEAVFDLTSHDGLGNELRDGLESLRIYKVNADKLPLKKVKARKRSGDLGGLRS